MCIAISKGKMREFRVHGWGMHFFLYFVSFFKQHNYTLCFMRSNKAHKQENREQVNLRAATAEYVLSCMKAVIILSILHYSGARAGFSLTDPLNKEYFVYIKLK